jgi:hypothetical protein
MLGKARNSFSNVRYVDVIRLFYLIQDALTVVERCI